MRAPADSKQFNAGRRDQRIIERPRLTRLLDGSDARAILLLAPAGYGKTTLARQWAKTLSGMVWITATPAHRDVATFAEDVASGIDAIGGDALQFITEYLQARSNPQRAARDIGIKLATRIDSARTQWIVIDDYQELSGSAEVEELIAVIEDRTSARFLVASRLRPHWATSRRVVYGDVCEFGRDELAMTPAECARILPPRPEHARAAADARGWPAVLGLIAALALPSPPEGAMPQALHQYLAEELFQSATERMRGHLLTLALAPDLSPETVYALFGVESGTILEQAHELGFLSGEGQSDLHPLLREFLLAKLSEERGAEERVRLAVVSNVERGHWDRALELVLRFTLLDLVDPILDASFKPLVRSGRLGSLSEFAAKVASAPMHPPASIDVVEAEVALRDGQLSAAIEIATRARERLSQDHVLRSRVNAIIGHGSFLLAAFPASETSFEDALAAARDDRDEAEALHGLALAKVFGERAGAREAVEALAVRRHASPTDLARYATAELSRRRFSEGLGDPLYLEEPKRMLARVQDPRARSALTHAAASALAQRADYADARTWLELLQSDVRDFALEFALPYFHWTEAQVHLGLRRFGDAERSIQAVEDCATRWQDRRHELNARVLRARLLLQLGKTDHAVEAVRADANVALIPHWRGEYFATRALALACCEQGTDALAVAKQAEHETSLVEVRVLIAATRAVVSYQKSSQPPVELCDLAARLGVWDPVVCAVRSCPGLAGALASDPRSRGHLEALYTKSNDLALARRAGFRTRATRPAADLLSPREFEVLGLITRGLRNREIAKALYISESTTKVHVRHVLEKLGVRTRAEAASQHSRVGATDLRPAEE
jgi:LuxR family transcriptional regulator, maltose regulon positive regulatory protein